VPATTCRTESLDGEQAGGALPQRVVGELISPPPSPQSRRRQRPLRGGGQRPPIGGWQRSLPG
jgi:hypothetical protein